MNRKLLSVLLVLVASMLFFGCSDDSETTTTTPTATSFSSNITGTWHGNLTNSAATPVIVNVNQPTSDAAAQALTGSVSINGGAGISVIGTKDGNAWTLSTSSGGVILTIHQTLSSATQSTGDFSEDIGGVKISAGLNLTKS